MITAPLVTHQHSEHSQNASTLSNLFEGCVQGNGLKFRIPIEIDVENNRVGADFGSDAAVSRKPAKRVRDVKSVSAAILVAKDPCFRTEMKAAAWPRCLLPLLAGLDGHSVRG